MNVVIFIPLGIYSGIIFQKEESSSINLIDSRFGAEATDNVRFHLKGD